MRVTHSTKTISGSHGADRDYAGSRNASTRRGRRDSTPGRVAVRVRLLVAAVAGWSRILIVVGLAALFPFGWHAAGTPIAGTVPGTVEEGVEEPCAVGVTDGTCRRIVVAVEGIAARDPLWPGARHADRRRRDQVRLSRSSDRRPARRRAELGGCAFIEVDRRGSMLLLALVFAVLAAVLLRWRGVLAVLGLVVSVALLLGFVVPAILAGKPALLVALVAALAVMFVTLLLTNGLGVQTLAAALGITATLVFTCALAYLAVRFNHLDGTSDLEMLEIKAGSQTLSLQGVILAGMLIGALGVLADTAVTQASAVMALRRATRATASASSTARAPRSAATTSRPPSTRSCWPTPARRCRCC